MSKALQFRVLGSLEVTRDGRPLPVARGKERALLALLLLHRNEVVAADKLVDDLWGGEHPRTAQTALHGYVGKLRRLLGTERLLTRGSAYLLHVEEGELDAERFELLLGEGRPTEALALWRGPPLFEVRDEPFARAEVGRLEELRLVALERCLEEKVDDGHAEEAIGELEALVREQPYREQLRSLLMLALYRAGRQADALGTYRELRRAFVDELGIEPSAEVRELEQRILAQDPTLTLQTTAIAEPAPVPAGEQRKTATVAYCDLVGSTALGDRLDAEGFRAVVERFVDTCTAVIEQHGGTLADLSGDAVIGVFGVPRAYEDDALRAVRASAEIAETLAPLDLEARVGVATGELVVGGRLAAPTGDAVNVAARLQAKSRPGEVLLDAATHARCREAVSVHSFEVRLKGKPEAVTAYRLLAPPTEPTPFQRRLDVPLVGRERELDDLQNVFERMVERRDPCVTIILGAPGVGKTRLAREFGASIGSRAQVVTGRCVAYGQGTAHGPLRELVIDAFGADRPRERIVEALSGDDDATAVANDLLAAAGLGQSATTRQETLWAVRRAMRSLAIRRPLVIVVEDAHWAEETFLDLLENLVDLSAGVPLMVLCLARPEFAEERASWLGRRQNARIVRIGPLSIREARAHVDHLGRNVDAELRARVVDQAGGNPLFAEQLLSHALERGGSLETPATLEALLAARIDGLDAAERAAIDAAAVVGEEFTLAAVNELLPEELRGTSPGAVAALVRRDFVRPERSATTADAFRFCHSLVHETAYAAILKRRRAELHEAFASWLEQQPGGQEALIGAHLELAHASLVDIGAEGTQTAAIAHRGAKWLGAAGWEAVRVGNFVSAEALASRALTLADDADPGRADALIARGNALMNLRRNPEAADMFREAAAGESGAARRAELYLLQQRANVDPALQLSDVTGMEANARAAALAFEKAGDDRGSYVAWIVVHNVLYFRGRYEGALEAVERAITYGRRAGQLEARLLSRPMILHLYGPTPSSQALEHAAELMAAEPGAATTADTLAYGGVLHAMRGDLEQARDWVGRSQALWRDIGADGGGWYGEESNVNVLAGDWPAAEASLRAQCELLDEPGLENVFATYAATLAHVLLELGRDSEAEEWAEEARRRATPIDLPVQAAWRAVRARVLAGRGAFGEAEALARESISLAEETDDLWGRGDVQLRFGEVLTRAGRLDEARAKVADALRSYEAKEHLVGIARARRKLDALADSNAA
jgi:DNA-binding SARP family transcriptional activator/tetratricopeptide (TPR) repeat protein